VKIILLFGLLLVALFSSTISAEAQVSTNAQVELSWDALTPAEMASGVTFYVVSHTNVAAPKLTWPVIGSTTNLSFVYDVVPGERYYLVYPSNFWGVGPFSQVAATPAPLRDDQSNRLRIKKAN
jgi:hypothetical protein